MINPSFSWYVGKQVVALYHSLVTLSTDFFIDDTPGMDDNKQRVTKRLARDAVSPSCESRVDMCDNIASDECCINEHTILTLPRILVICCVKFNINVLGIT